MYVTQRYDACIIAFIIVSHHTHVGIDRKLESKSRIYYLWLLNTCVTNNYADYAYYIYQ